jgi:uncharacterized protein YhhL (DUF1145 family)
MTICVFMLTKQKRAQGINFTHLANKCLHCHWRVKLNHLVIPFTNVNNHVNIFSEMLVLYSLHAYDICTITKVF